MVKATHSSSVHINLIFQSGFWFRARFQNSIFCLTVSHHAQNDNTFLIVNFQQAYTNLTIDMELAQREHFHFGAKLVRGAYMEQERARAEEIGYIDPINVSYEATNQSYHRCLNHMLTSIKTHGDCKMMVASHNEETIRFTIQR